MGRTASLRKMAEEEKSPPPTKPREGRHTDIIEDDVNYTDNINDCEDTNKKYILENIFLTRIRNKKNHGVNKENILVIGETKNHSELLTNMGGDYIPALKGYLFDKSIKRNLIKLGVKHISDTIND